MTTKQATAIDAELTIDAATETRRLTGVVDCVFQRHARVSDLHSWRRSEWFAHVSEFETGELPPAGTMIEFTPDATSDPRGPVARQIAVTAGAPSDAHRVCVLCGALFIVSARSLVWLQAQGWPVPRRCERCRRARQPWPNVTSV